MSHHQGATALPPSKYPFLKGETVFVLTKNCYGRIADKHTKHHKWCVDIRETDGRVTTHILDEEELWSAGSEHQHGNPGAGRVSKDQSTAAVGSLFLPGVPDPHNNSLRSAGRGRGQDDAPAKGVRTAPNDREEYQPSYMAPHVFPPIQRHAPTKKEGKQAKHKREAAVIEEQVVGAPPNGNAIFFPDPVDQFMDTSEAILRRASSSARVDSSAPPRNPGPTAGQPLSRIHGTSSPRQTPHPSSGELNPRAEAFTPVVPHATMNSPQDKF